MAFGGGKDGSLDVVPTKIRGTVLLTGSHNKTEEEDLIRQYANRGILFNDGIGWNISVDEGERVYTARMQAYLLKAKWKNTDFGNPAAYADGSSISPNTIKKGDVLKFYDPKRKEDILIRVKSAELFSKDLALVVSTRGLPYLCRKLEGKVQLDYEIQFGPKMSQIIGEYAKEKKIRSEFTPQQARDSLVRVI